MSKNRTFFIYFLLSFLIRKDIISINKQTLTKLQKERVHFKQILLLSDKCTPCFVIQMYAWLFVCSILINIHKLWEKKQTSCCFCPFYIYIYLLICWLPVCLIKGFVTDKIIAYPFQQVLNYDLRNLTYH